MNVLKQSIYGAVDAQLKMRNMRDTVKTLINQATLELHVSRFFTKDQRFGVTDVTPPAQTYKTDLSGLQDYRGLTSIILATTQGPVEITKFSSLAEFAAESKKCERGVGTPVAFLMGSILQIKAPYPIEQVYVGYLSLPNIGDNDYDSWIASMYPTTVIDEVLYRVKTNIGDKSTQAHVQAVNRARIRLYGDQETLIPMG